MRRLFANLAVLACLSVATPAMAEITAAERAEVSSRVAAFSAEVVEMDVAAMFDFLPPKMLQQIATQAGGTVEQLRAAAQAAGQHALQGARISDYAMDVDGATAAVTPDGARDYLLIPTMVVVEAETMRIRVDTHTLAFRDDGQWYLLRVQEASHIAILRQAYPEFAGVDFPAGRTTTLE
jgi:hypothetical protein